MTSRRMTESVVMVAAAGFMLKQENMKPMLVTVVRLKARKGSARKYRTSPGKDFVEGEYFFKRVKRQKVRPRPR